MTAARLLVAGLATFVAACATDSVAPTTSDSKPKAPPPQASPAATVGSLAITITAPAGATPNVVVTGPSGFKKSLSATATIGNLAPGRYVVSASTIATTDPVAPVIDTAIVTGTPDTITAGKQSTASVTYAQRPGTGGLWIASAHGPTTELLTAGLPNSGSVAPATALTDPTASSTAAIAFDQHGNLWIASDTVVGSGTGPFTSVGAIAEFAAATLGNAPATPVLTIASGGIDGLAFDAAGNLWAVSTHNNRVIQFSAAQLSHASGASSPTPADTLVPAGVVPLGIAVAPNGAIWVVGQGGTLAEWTQTAMGSPPSLVVTPGGPHGPFFLLGAAMPIFDAAGDLWLPTALPLDAFNNSTVLELTAAQLSAGLTRSSFPATFAAAANSSLAGGAFDASGKLWVVDNGNQQIIEYGVGQQLTLLRAIQTATTGFPHALAFDLSGRR